MSIASETQSNDRACVNQMNNRFLLLQEGPYTTCSFQLRKIEKIEWLRTHGISSGTFLIP